MTTLASGARLGPYEIESTLGAGGMGVVYSARDTRLGRRVAIKVLSAELTLDDAAQRRFLKEARTASALDHPNICTIHDISESPTGLTYLVMARYEGQTLAERIAQGPVPLDMALAVVDQLLAGLGRAHAAGIVHRDIKPANVMLTRDGPVKILDFGLATLSSAHHVTEASEGVLVGTVAYMSPEQATGLIPDHRADLWAVGIVLFEMLMGERPFRGDNLLAIAHAIRTHPAPPLSGAGQLIEPVVRRVLEKDPARRYASAEDFASDLRVLRPAASTPVSLATTTTPAPAVATKGAPTSSGERRTNLPRVLPSLVGREELLERITATLVDTPLITLAGFGGVGKTRLAQQAGLNAVSAFRDGVWFVDLAGVAPGGDVLPSVARAMGIRENASESLSVTLAATLRDRNLLFILDNCERVTEGVARFAEETLEAAPGVRFVATSLQPLGLYGEHVVRVEGLDEQAAIALFEERAAMTRAYQSADRAVLSELCRRLDYLPLAIELAAARVRSLTPREILARLSERFAMLKATDRRAARHQTLEAAVAWSYDLLPDPEQLLLNRLSVFVGSFDLPAVERVCHGGPVLASDLVDLLDRLVDKSLVSATAMRDTMRYRIMDTVREYAARRLDEAGEREARFDAHARYFATQAQTLGDRIRTSDTRGASAALLSDIDNINAAIDRLGAQGRYTQMASLVTSLDLFWQIGAPGSGRRRFEQLVQVLDQIDLEIRFSTLLEAASFFCTVGFVTQALSLLDRARATAAAHDIPLPAYFHYVEATAAEMDGRSDDVMAACAAGHASLDEAPDDFMEVSLRSRVLTSVARQSLPEALAHARETLRLSEACGLDLFVAVSHMLIGTVHMLDGRMADSESECARAIELAGTAMPQVSIAALVASAVGLREVDPVRSIARAREALRVEAQSDIMPWFRVIAGSLIAWHWARGARAEDAATVLGAVDDLGRRMGFAGLWWSQPLRAEAWQAVEQRVPAARISELTTRGRLLAMAQLRQLLDAD